MKHRLIRGFICGWAITLAAMAAVPLSAQILSPAAVSPAITKFVQQTAARVAKTRKQKILLVPRATCLLDEQRCAEMDSLLRPALAKAIPGAQLLGHDDIVPRVKARGLLGIDSYFIEVLEFYAIDAGADILLTESLATDKHGRELWIRVYDTSARKEIALLKSKDVRPLSAQDEEPLIVQDAESGVSMVVPRGVKPRTYPDTRAPECDVCPNFSFNPQSAPWAGEVVILGTVNTDGRIVDAKVLQGFGTEQSAAVLKAQELQRFKPAIGVDGKPFPVRRVFLTTFTVHY